MGRALRVISVERGSTRAVRAGGVRRRGRAACLRGGRGAGDPAVLVPRAGGVLSALVWPCRTCAVTTYVRCSAATRRGRVRGAGAAGGRGHGRAELRRRADLRYRGQAFELTVAADDREVEEHSTRRTSSVRLPDGRRAVEIVNIRGRHRARRAPGAAAAGRGDAERARQAIVDGDWRRGAGAPARRDGRAEVAGRPSSSTPSPPAWCRPGWAGAVDNVGQLVLEHADEPRPGHALGPGQRAAAGRRGDGRGAGPRRYSANIKERRDCSTALFDAHGRMVAQAEHIPVHLGAMTGSVAAVLATRPNRATCSCSTIRSTAARTCPTSRWSRRPSPATWWRTRWPAPTTPRSAGCAQAR